MGEETATEVIKRVRDSSDFTYADGERVYNDAVRLADAYERVAADLALLRRQTRGVFCEATGAVPPPGPRLDTPAERLRRKREGIR